MAVVAGMVVAGVMFVAPSADARTKSPTTTTTTTRPTFVHPGAFCSPPGKKGQTTKHTRMICAKASDGRYRWIQA
jgi:hypothetical protein